MKRTDRNIAPRHGLSLLLVLVAVLLFWSQSGFVFWQVARKFNYTYLRTKTLSKERDTIILSQSEFIRLAWVKDDEIRHNGKMFDVKRKFSRDGNIVLTGHYDTHDDKLFSWLYKMLDDGSNSKQGKHKFQFWFCEAIVDNIAFVPGSQYVECPRYYPKESTLHSFYFSHISPPPKTC